MGGVFGVIDGNRSAILPSILSRVEHCTKLCDWHTTQTWIDCEAGVGLGQVHIGIFSTEPQPARSDDGSITVCTFGEFYNAEAIRRGLRAKGYHFSSHTDAELVLRLYEDQGERLASTLEGVFVLAVWDNRRRRLILANDRYGLIPLYYACFNNKLLFSPLVRGILQDPAFPRRLNLTALSEFFRFQRLLGDKTFFEDIQLLPYGSLLCFDADSASLSVTHYWDFDQIPRWPAGISFAEAVVETGRLMRQAVQRRLESPGRVGVYLSGGLDSRTILGFAGDTGTTPPSITYGFPNSWDVFYARQLAQRLGSRHYYFPQTDGKWLKDFVDLHLMTTEGHTSFIHAHSANTLRPARQLIDVNLTGFNGDQLLGGRGLQLARPAVESLDEMAFLAHTYQHLTHDFSWPGLTEAEERLLYTDAIYPHMRDRAFESLRQELAPYSRFAPPRRWDFFTAIHQGTRLSNLNLVFQRAFFEARYPFCDYRLQDFVYAMPFEFRLHDRLYLAVLNREIPKVTWVPRDSNHQLLTDRKLIRKAHSLLHKTRQRLNRYIPAIGHRYQSLHGDPEDWLRDDLRDWASDILFDRRTLDRGIVNPTFLRSIFDRHMSGREQWTIGKIAPIITFEMMMRAFFDETPGGAAIEGLGAAAGRSEEQPTRIALPTG